MKKHLCLLLFFVLLCFGGCGGVVQDFGALNFIETKSQLMFTAFFNHSETKKIIKEMNDFMGEFENQISTKIPSSQLSVFNGSTSTEPFEIGEHFYTLFNLSKQYNEILPDFNPAIFPVLKLWKLDDFNSEDIYVPLQEEIDALLPLCSMSNFSAWEENGKFYIKKNAGMENAQLDFGAIAKGFACDEVLKIAKSFGINKIKLNYSGNVGFISPYKKTKESIRNPFGGYVEIEVSLKEFGVVTSGTYERFKIAQDGTAYHHILNRNGINSGEIASATIIHQNGTFAEAVTTALVCQTVSEAKTIINSLNLKAVLIGKNEKKVVFNNV